MPSSYALGEHFETFVRKQVETGRYASASEVVRDALRLLKDNWKSAKLPLRRFEESWTKASCRARRSRQKKCLSASSDCTGISRSPPHGET